MNKKLLALYMAVLLFALLIAFPVSAANVTLDLNSQTAAAGDLITASGNAQPHTWVAIKIIDSSQNIVLFDAVKSNAEGFYTYSFNLPAVAAGTLTMISGYGDNTASRNFSCSNRLIDVGLVISGSAVSQPLYLTKDELKNIADGRHAEIKCELKNYSVMAKGGIKTMICARGIDLGALLQWAGIGKESYIISTISADKNRVDLKYNGSSKCFEPQQYYYADMLPGNNGESGPVAPILALHRAMSTAEDYHPHLPTPQELTEVEQFPLPTLTIGQTDRDDYNNQFNNKYVQQIIAGGKESVIFTISGSGLKKNLSFTKPDLWLQGIEQTFWLGKECDGISLQRLLNSIDGLQDSDHVSWIKGESGGLVIYHAGGRIEHVTGLLIGKEGENTLPLSRLKDPAQQYFLVYDATASAGETPSRTPAANETLAVRPIILTETKWEEQKAADLQALPDRKLVDMNSFLRKKNNGNNSTVFELEPSAWQEVKKSEKNSLLLFTARGRGTDFNLEMSSDFLSQLQEREMYLQISMARGNLIIPATAVDTANILQELGEIAYTLQFNLNELSRQQSEAISCPDGYTLQSLPLSTEMFAVAGEEKIKIVDFDDYVYKELLLSQSIAPMQCIGLCWEDNELLPRTLPFVFIERNGQIFARVYSNSNSIYAVAASDATNTFGDIKNHWAQQNVEVLASKLILQGRSKDIFDPDCSVSRAEFAAMLVRALGLVEPLADKFGFNDINGDEWYTGCVAAAVKGKLINGMDDGSFKPQQNISRQEAAVMMSRALQFTSAKNLDKAEEKEQLLAQFSDQEDIAAWAYPQFAAVVQAEIMQGNNERRLMPQQVTSRAEAAKMILSLLRKAELIDERDTFTAKSPSSQEESRESQDGVLLIQGSAIAQPRTFTFKELKAMTDIVVRDSYYSRGKEKDGWAAEQHDSFKGVSLYELLLKKIGLTDIPNEVKVIADDGYSKVFTMDEIASWYIDETKAGKKLEMILAWEQNGKEFNQAQPFRLVYGQKYEGDFNRQNWINYVKTIIID